MRRYVATLILLAVSIIIFALYISFSKGIIISHANTVEKEINGENFNESGVRFLTPSGTPLTFYRLPNGDYYTIIQIQSQSNYTGVPFAMDYPFKAGIVSEVRDNTTGLYNVTYVVVVSGKDIQRASESDVIKFWDSSLKNYAYYTLNIVDTPGNLSDEVIKALEDAGENVTNSTSSNGGNGANSTVQKLFSMGIRSAVVTFSPIVSARSFDGIVLGKHVYVQARAPASGLSEYLGGTSETPLSSGFTVNFTFGYSGTKLSVTKFKVNGTLIIYAPPVGDNKTLLNISSGSSELVVSSSGATTTLSYNGSSFTSINGVFAVENGELYVLTGNIFADTGVSADWLKNGSEVSLDIFAPNVSVVVANETVNDLNGAVVEAMKEAIAVARSFAEEYYNTTLGKLPSIPDTEFYSIFNTNDLPSDFSLIPTTVASGKYDENVTYQLTISDDIMYLQSVGGVNDKKGGLIPTDYLEDDVETEKGIGVASFNYKPGYALKMYPNLVPAGSTRFVFFGNTTFIMQNLSWIIGSKDLRVISKGQSTQMLYQGGEYGKYLVVTAWNETTKKIPPISYSLIDHHKDSSWFCCFGYVDNEAKGITIYINDKPIDIEIVGDNGKYEYKGKYFPYDILLEDIQYVGGLSCEYDTLVAPKEYSKCPHLYFLSYTLYKLYMKPNPPKSITHYPKSKYQTYEDYPCYMADLNILEPAIFTVIDKYSMPDSFTAVEYMTGVVWALMDDEVFFGNIKYIWEYTIYAHQFRNPRVSFVNPSFILVSI